MIVDDGAREVRCKIVYYGPGMAGTTTNLRYIQEHALPDANSQASIFMDMVSFEGGEICGRTARFQLHNPPKSVIDVERDRRLFRGVDGVVFIADSHAERLEADILKLESLESLLAFNGLAIDRIPLVFQYNKRDVPSAVSIAELEAALNPWRRPAFSAVATTGVGVLATLAEIVRQVLAASERLSRSGPL